MQVLFWGNCSIAGTKEVGAGSGEEKREKDTVLF